ncbi:MAG: hypothetical protein ACK5D8_06870 [Bacteroidota bacterium]
MAKPSRGGLSAQTFLSLTGSKKVTAAIPNAYAEQSSAGLRPALPQASRLWILKKLHFTISRNYTFHNKEGIYFVGFAAVFWVGVFVRRICFDGKVENLNMSMVKKGKKGFCWCIMSSHTHLIFQSKKQRPEGLLRDFK